MGVVRKVGKTGEEMRTLLNASVLQGVVEAQQHNNASLDGLRAEMAELVEQQRASVEAFRQRDERMNVWEDIVERLSALEVEAADSRARLNELVGRARQGEQSAKELPGVVNTLVEATITTFNDRHQAYEKEAVDQNRKEIAHCLDKNAKRFEEAMTSLKELQDNVATQAGQVQSATEEQKRLTEEKWGIVEKQLQFLCDAPKPPEGPAKGEPVMKLFKVMRDIERRGNIKIDSRTGEMEVKDLPWTAKKPPAAPAGELSNEKAAETILSDLADIVDLFGVPMTVEGHMKQGQGGNAAWWQDLADSRMQHLVDLLEKRGVDAALLNPKGLPGKKGLNKAALIVKFELH